jgi:arylsulfatase A-like enzyme
MIAAWGVVTAGILLHCAAPSRVGPNVILISIDTLRADRLGTYGYDRDTSPALDALAAEGVVFEHVVAESPWTLPSHVTMLSGIHPDGHGVTVPDLRPHPELPSLPAELRDRGYLTLGFTDGGYVGAQYGFDRGFAVFDESPDGLGAALDEAMPLIEDAGDRPFFLFLHTYDTHCPYDPAPEYASQFATDSARSFETAGKCGNPQYNQMVFKPGQLEHVSNMYDAGIRELDDRLAGFFARLESAGLREDTLIIVTSDHGEEFMEHGQIGHERSLYREVLMIPLIVVGPGIAPGRSRAPAALVDIVPTITTFLGGAASSVGDGRALLTRDETSSWRPISDDDRVLTSTLSWKLPLRSTMDARLHRIRNTRAERDELYDFRDDPLETQNLLDDAPVATPRLMPGLVAGDPDHGPIHAPQPIEAITPEQAERLRNLGYLQ